VPLLPLRLIPFFGYPRFSGVCRVHSVHFAMWFLLAWTRHTCGQRDIRCCIWCSRYCRENSQESQRVYRTSGQILRQHTCQMLLVVFVARKIDWDATVPMSHWGHWPSQISPRVLPVLDLFTLSDWGPSRKLCQTQEFTFGHTFVLFVAFKVGTST